MDGVYFHKDPSVSGGGVLSETRGADALLYQPVKRALLPGCRLHALRTFLLRCCFEA